MSGPNYEMTVIDTYCVKGRGLGATGTASCKPRVGPVTIRLPDGTEEDGYVSGIERFAIDGWWRHAIGLLLRGRESLPVGSVIIGPRDDS